MAEEADVCRWSLEPGKSTAFVNCLRVYTKWRETDPKPATVEQNIGFKDFVPRKTSENEYEVSKRYSGGQNVFERSIFRS